MELTMERYGALLAERKPRPIRTGAEFDAAVQEIETFDFAGRSLTAEEAEYRELLAVLIKQYDEATCPPAPGDPLETLKFLMDQNGLRRADLLDVFGSRSVASAVLSGKRGISKAAAKKLGTRFRVEAGLFL